MSVWDKVVHAPHGTPHEEALHGRTQQGRRDAGSDARALAAPNDAAHQLQRGLFWLLRYHVGSVQAEQRRVP